MLARSRSVSRIWVLAWVASAVPCLAACGSSNSGAPNGCSGACDDDGGRTESDAGAESPDSSAVHDAGPSGDSGTADATSPPSEAGSSEAGPADASTPDASPDAGGIVPANGQMTSGTRLKGQWYQAQGGARLASIYDTALGIPCSWQYAADGMLRCLPTNVVEMVDQIGITYLDSSCGQPTYGVAAAQCAPTADQFVMQGAPTCPGGQNVYSIGGAVAVPPSLYYFDATQKCLSANGLEGSTSFYSLTELPPTNFVAGTEVLGAASGSLVPVYVNGADGSTTFESVRDTSNGSVDCAFATATDGTLRCLPSTTVTLSGNDPQLYVDAKCTVQAAQSDTTTCASVPFATNPPVVAAGCPSATTVYSVGAGASTVYEQTVNGCAVFNDPGPSFFALGAVSAPTLFTKGVTTHGAGAGRLQPTFVTAGALAVDASFGIPSAYTPGLVYYDTMLGADCVPAVAGDSTLRCLPLQVLDPGSVVFTYPGAFSDAACTQPLGLTNNIGCTQPKYALAVTSACGQLPTATNVYPIEATITGSIYTLSGTTCTGQPVPAGYTAFTLGAEMAPTSFVAIQTSVF